MKSRIEEAPDYNLIMMSLRCGITMSHLDGTYTNPFYFLKYRVMKLKTSFLKLVGLQSLPNCARADFLYM